jgi:hypothetical protein
MRQKITKIGGKPHSLLCGMDSRDCEAIYCGLFCCLIYSFSTDIGAPPTEQAKYPKLVIKLPKRVQQGVIVGAELGFRELRLTVKVENDKVIETKS